MPKWDIDLSDGTTVTVESESEPTDEEVLASVGGVGTQGATAPPTDIGGSFMFPAPETQWARNPQSLETDTSRPLPQFELQDPGLLSSAAPIAAGLEIGGNSLEKAYRSGLDLVGWYPLLDKVTGSGTKYQDYNKGWMDYFANREAQLQRENVALGQTGFVPEVLQGTARAAVELPAQLLGGAAAATPKAAVIGSSLTAGVLGGLADYGQERQEGKGRLEAASKGAVSGAITAVTTRAFGATGIESIFKKEGVTGIRNRIFEALKQTGYEIADESLDQFQQDLLERVTKNPNKPIAQTVYDVLLAGTIGGVLGGGVSVATQGANVAREAITQDKSQPVIPAEVPAGAIDEAAINRGLEKTVAEAPQPDWRVAVQPAEGEVPGFVQIVDPRGTEQSQSPTVESLRAAGYEVPDFSKLPKGSYTYGEAAAKLKEMEAAPKKPNQNQPTKTPIPEAKDVTSASYKLGREIKAEDIPRLEAERAGVQSEYAEAIKTAMQTGNFSAVEEIAKRSQFLDEAIKFRRGLDESAKLGKPTNAQLAEIEQRIGLAANALGRSSEEAPVASSVEPLRPSEFKALVAANQPIPADRMDASGAPPPAGWVLKDGFYVPQKTQPEGGVSSGQEVQMQGQEEVLSDAPAVGFLPRQSEAQGLGEPALPPTVQDIRTQRLQESRAQTRQETGFTPEELEGEITGETPAASNVAPGAKTTESRGTWFAGKNPRETSKMMQSRANFFLQGKTDDQAVVDLTRMAGGDPDVQLDNQAANFVIKDLLVSATKRAQSAKNQVDANAAWSMVDRLSELSRRLGAEDARSLVSRNLAYKQIDWLMPALAWRGIVKEQWRKSLGIPEGQPFDETVITPQEAKKRGLPELNGEQSRKLAELAKEAEAAPQGVRRNKVMEEMIREMQKGLPVSKLDLLRDVWYGSVLMRVGTMLNVLAGSYSTGASFAGLAALDRTLQLKPLQAMKIVGQFIGGTIEGTLIADQIARKGAYHLLPDAEQRMVNLLSGKAGARFDNLEEMLRRGNPIGVLAYTRRFMAALDYIGALGTRNSQVLYGALTRGDQESLDALDKRYDKAENKRAEQQAKTEMGPKASRVEVMARKREILEEGVDEEIKERAIQIGRRAAQNAEPRGIPGFFYRTAAKLPFWVRAPAGLAFMRSAMNMVQNAADYMPGIGAVTALRGKMGTLPTTHPLHAFGMDIPVEERRMMLAAQVSSLGIVAITAAMFLGDDDEKEDGWEISGSWRGLSPKQKSQLMEMGERPNSIRFGKKSPWISFKQMPFAPPLAIVGTMRDEERFHAKDWEGQSVMDKVVPAWLSGLLYIRDISSLSGVAAMFDGNAWNTQETPTKLNEKINKFAAQSVGRAGAGYIPSILKEIDEFGDQTLYRPSKEEMSGWWIRNVPYARRTVGPGPALNSFGEPIQLTPPPIKSWAGFGKDNELYQVLGQLASRGIFLPEPGTTAKIVDKTGERREMNEEEWYRFIKIRGPIFKAEIIDNLEEIRKGDEDSIALLRHISDAASKEARGEISE